MHHAPADGGYQSLIERIPGIVYRCAMGAEGEWLYVSPPVQSILGYSPAEWREDPTLWFKRLHPEDRAKALDDEARSRATGEPLDSEYRMIARDGSVIWFHDQASLVRDADGRRLWLEGVMLDISDRKRAEAALRASEKRYREIIEATNVGVWMIDPEYRTTYANPRTARMLGYTLDEMLGKPLWDFFDEDASAEWAARFRETLPGQFEQVEARFTRKDGSDLWTLLSSNELTDEAGNYGGSLAMLIDITEREQAEQEIHKSRARLAAAQGLAHVGSWEWDLTTDALDWSDEHYRIMGLQPEEFVPTYEAAVERFHPDDREQLDAAIKTALQEKGSYQHECRIVRPDLVERVVDSRGHVVTDGDGDVTRMVGTIQDVTERKQAEQEIRRRARHQAALASLGRQALAETDLTALMRMALDATAAILEVDHVRVLELRPDGQGFTLRAGIGPGNVLDDGTELPIDNASQANYTLTAGSAVVVEDLRSETRFTNLMMRDHGAVSGASVMIEERGSSFGVLSVHTTSRRKFTGEDVSFLEGVANVLGAAIARDRAEQLEAQLRQAQRLESIGQLAGGIAHDFNNLLSVILNYARFAIDELEDGAVREDVEEIKKAAERAADLTHQLLVFSRRQVVQPEVMDINATVRETEGMLVRTLGEHIDMHSKLEPELWPVKLGAGQIEQILINLAVNSRDAMPTGGRLEIRTENVELHAEATRGEWSIPAGRYAHLTVLDTGTGMDRHVTARAFDPFFTNKPTGSGTGLGLATVYGIVKQAGGYAEIDSEVGRGTAVKIYLPAQDGPRATAAPVSPEDESLRGNGETILLVEDEPAVRALTKRILSSNDYRVIEAADGVSALSVWRDHVRSVDLLLTDVVMPHLSGTELAVRMKAAEPGLKTLYMSGYSDVISHHEAIEEGLLLVEKPFSPGKLLRNVRAALDGGNPVHESNGESHAC